MADFRIIDRPQGFSMAIGDAFAYWDVANARQEHIAFADLKVAFGSLWLTPLATVANLTAIGGATLDHGNAAWIESLADIVVWDANATSGDYEPDDKALPGVDPGYWIRVRGASSGGIDSKTGAFTVNSTTNLAVQGKTVRNDDAAADHNISLGEGVADDFEFTVEKHLANANEISFIPEAASTATVEVIGIPTLRKQWDRALVQSKGGNAWVVRLKTS